MREIKFRAWRKKAQIMVKVKKMSLGEFIIYDLPHTKQGFGFSTFDEIELMQYTGLKDQNGTEIYEGDIVKCIYDIFEYDHLEEITTIDKVVFNEGGAYVENDENTCVTSLAEIDTTMHCEVLGNIYENPELLEEIKQWEK